MAETINVGLIGCGNIAPRYVQGCHHFPILEVTACADIDMERAETLAEAHNLKACTVEQLLADPEIDIVVNLTVPQAHAEVSLRIIGAGKHVHSEKPLALRRADGKKILDAAQKAGVRVGCAPDTFLGGGIQTCRKLIDEGAIGEPVAATAFMAGHGPESWHPNPIFFYQFGGGPLFDMGPYYLTTLIYLLGPIKRIAGLTRMSFPERVATSEVNYGKKLAVEVNTHVAGLLDFASGPVGTIITSFDVWAHQLPRIEIYGTEGTISVPDPNTFGGPVKIWLLSDKEWREVPLTHDDSVRRGVGVADLGYALLSGRPHRASGDMAYHVLDIMEAFDESSDSGRHIPLTSHCEKPAALPDRLAQGELDA